MIKRNFLDKDDRARLTSIARDGLEEHGVARRANAILLLDRGWGCEKVSDALLLEDDTIRNWLKIYREGGVEAIATFDFAGLDQRGGALHRDNLGHVLHTFGAHEADGGDRFRVAQARTRAVAPRSRRSEGFCRAARETPQRTRGRRRHRLRRRRPSDPSDPGGRRLAVTR